MSKSQASGHRWRFFRAGGFDQVCLETGADLAHLGELDQKLWVALACPTTTIDFDPRTLELLDLDGDKRIRAPELIEACRWATSLLNNPDELTRSAAELPLDSIKLATPEGQALHDSAKQVLRSLGKPDADRLSVEEATHAVKTLNASPFNGDGVITAESVDAPDLAGALNEILETLGGQDDRSGKKGIDQKNVDAFFAELEAWTAWSREGASKPEWFPLGEKTAAAREVLRKLETKVEDFFARCRLAAFDARAGNALNRDDKDYAALAPMELSLAAKEIASFPLAHVSAGATLPLVTGLNPAWSDAVEQLRTELVVPLLGELTALTEAQWRVLRARFVDYDGWMGRKKGASVEKLGAARIEALLSGSTRGALTAVIAKDLAAEPASKALASVEKLALFHRDLFKLTNNFVSFRDFYKRKDKAVFQAGTLFIDQRSCDLCIRVEDVAKHSALAPLGRAYLVYADCVRAGKKMTIAAAFTAGDSENLMPGRNGVFYDRQGRDWDATITRIVDNPISVRQAFWAPYKKVLRFVESQVAKRATDADTAANSRLTEAATGMEKAADTGKTDKPAKVDIGVVAALGVAVGGIAAALGALLNAFFGLGIWMPLGFVALLFAISGPSMAIAYLKLRQRNLAPMLDANGWAMNSPARINIPFGSSLTQTAALPSGSSRDLKDQFAEKETPWSVYATAALLLVLAGFWFSGNADPFLPEGVRKVTVWDAPVPTAAAPVPAAAPTPALVKETK